MIKFTSGVQKKMKIEEQILQQANQKHKKGLFGRLFQKYKTLTEEACQDVEQLELKKIEITSFSILKQLPNLKSIFFYNCSFTEECLEEEIELKQVEEVDFEEVPIKDLTILWHFPNVEKIAFWEFGPDRIIHMSGIEYSPKIKRFYSVNTLFKEIERLAVCKGMRWLEFDNFLPKVFKKQEIDYSFINAFSDLIHIGLMTGNVEDVSFLCKNKNLMEIVLSQNTELKQIETLAVLKDLQKLDLDDCKIPKDKKKEYIKLFSKVEIFSIEN